MSWGWAARVRARKRNSEVRLGFDDWVGKRPFVHDAGDVGVVAGAFFFFAWFRIVGAEGDFNIRDPHEVEASGFASFVVGAA